MQSQLKNLFPVKANQVKREQLQSDSKKTQFTVISSRSSNLFSSSSPSPNQMAHLPLGVPPRPPTPPPKFTGLTSPAWIFSYASTSTSLLPVSPTPISIKLPRADKKVIKKPIELQVGEEPNYGPQLRRKGNVRFVRERGLGGGGGGEEGKGKGKEISEIYKEIVGRGKERKKRKITTTAQADIDLTLSSSDSEGEIIFLDPITHLPVPALPPPTPPPSTRPIHALLPTLPPPSPQISYGTFHSSHFAHKMLASQGWVEGTSLGLSQKEVGLIVPLKGVERVGRGGLGVGGGGGKKGREKGKEKEEEEEARRRMGIGGGGNAILRVKKKEERERKEMMAYMNR